MISKTQLLTLWGHYKNYSTAPQKYKPLFTVNGFMAFIQGSVLTDVDKKIVMRSLHSMHGSVDMRMPKWEYEWSYDDWIGYLHYVLPEVFRHYTDQYYHEVLDGILCLLEDDIRILKRDDASDEIKRFYSKTDYGYFDFPKMFAVAKKYNIDIPNLDRVRGFVDENAMPAFDMNEWDFNNQLTTLKDAVGREHVDFDDIPKYDNGGFNHYAAATKFYPFVEKITIIQHVIGKNIPLRKINDGACYIEDMIRDYGFVVGFYGTHPIWKVKTKQGFNFYIYDNDWYGGVYIDNINIKKIKFAPKKPKDCSLETEPRIFILHSNKGYFYLPELRYPTVYKKFVLNVLKQQKKIIGHWDEVEVYAASRTLNGKHLPDVRTKSEFTEAIQNSVASHLNKEYKELGLNFDVKTIGFDFDKKVQLLDCITQSDINKYVGLEDDGFSNYIIEYY